MNYFDYERVAREARIPAEKLKLIGDSFKRDYPHDEMLCELHILRACMAVRDGLATLDEVLPRQAAPHTNAA